MCVQSSRSSFPHLLIVPAASPNDHRESPGWIVRRNPTKNPNRFNWSSVRTNEGISDLRPPDAESPAVPLYPAAVLLAVHEGNMNPHACLLAFLIGPAAATAFAVQPPAQTPSERRQDCCCGSHRSAPLTRMHARRGGKGRRRGRVDGGGPATTNGAAAVSVRETPSTAAAIATLAIQHAAHEELLEVAYTNRSILRPAVLSQALLRIAKVCASSAIACSARAVCCGYTTFWSTMHRLGALQCRSYCCTDTRPPPCRTTTAPFLVQSAAC